MKSCKKVLIILNPTSGQKKANAEMTKIIQMFTAANYLPTVLTTLRRGDGTRYAKDLAAVYDLLVAIGGDGTFNEVAMGLIESGTNKPMGYIPSGSTNDFANSMNISSNIEQAVSDIIDGHPIALDVGDFNGRYFTYVASFGAFTKASYNTPQDIKNALGHLAYIISGINSITDIKPIHVKVETDGYSCEGDYIFGAISNSTSMGGVVKLDSKLVDTSDGKFEMLLVKNPSNVLEVGEIIRAAAESDFSDEKVFTFVSGAHFKVEIPSKADWSLDGEYQKGEERIEIKNMHQAVSVMVNK